VLTIDEARASVLGALPAVRAVEEVPVADALGRVLAAELRARGDVPPFPNSAMDGWAVRAGEAGRRLAIVGESRAGRPARAELGEGAAMRISTGAALPVGAEAVVRVEDSEESDDAVVLRAAAAAGDNVRLPGDDLRAGQLVLPAGTPLGPAEVAAVVAAGAAEVAVGRRPRLAVVCTGDELREPGATLGPGEIHNSNLPALQALGAQAGARSAGGEIVADDAAETRRALDDALAAADVLVISGGVSVGAHDQVKPALAALGVREVFWRVALQPGKPTWFGVRDDRLVFGLPGNPVSALVTFVLFVRPALRALQGGEAEAPRGRARLAHAVPRNPEREQAVRVGLSAAGDGTLTATPTGRQNSHLITSVLGADALALVPAGSGELAAGALVETVALFGRP
jgi:molybdopterin molybdotransferase